MSGGSIQPSASSQPGEEARPIQAFSVDSAQGEEVLGPGQAFSSISAQGRRGRGAISAPCP